MSNAVNKLILERLDAIEVDLEKKYLEYDHAARHSREHDAALIAIRLLEGERRELEDNLVVLMNLDNSVYAGIDALGVPMADGQRYTGPVWMRTGDNPQPARFFVIYKNSPVGVQWNIHVGGFLPI